MRTNLAWIGERARQEPKLVFTSLYHHLYDIDHLRACYEALPAHKATGVDGVTKAEYGKHLEENLHALSTPLRRQSYHPPPSRRAYIPKPGRETGRPLGLSNLEAKIVERAVKRPLEPIYEPVFEDSSDGYRPGRSAQDCLDLLGRTIQQRRVNHVVEADIRKFFDTVNHDWMMEFLAHRIGDRRVLRLIHRMLQCGILEDGLFQASTAGTPQGSILSPRLSNIYLHYVLDLWFRHRVCKQSVGEAYYFRFADDFLACFQSPRDTERFHYNLRCRLEDFGLSLAEEKTRCIAFGRFARTHARRRGETPQEFDFLGFTHYCGQTRRGDFKVKRRTSRPKFHQKLQDFKGWARRSRQVLNTGRLLRCAAAKMAGHLSDYAITDNFDRCSSFVYHATRVLFKWLNRRSQRLSYTWEGYLAVLAQVRWPTPRILHHVCPFRRATAH